MKTGIAALIAAGAVLVPGAAGAPKATPYNGRIAFQSINTIVLVNPDGTGLWPTRATAIGSVDDWSPDGTKLLVEAQSDLFVVDPDGGNRRRLTSSVFANDGQAKFSPDGTRIAFFSTRDGVGRVWVMNADGTGAHTITSNFAAGTPTWSPDGSQIAFATGYSEIWITSSEGIGARHLVGSTAEPAFEPAWSPDGKTILVSQRHGGSAQIYAVDVESGSERALTATDANDYNPVWSPDGTRIAFESDRTGREDIWTMAADGSDVRQLTYTGGFAGRPAWQPLGPAPNGCRIWGTAANDLLVGSGANDAICGEGGDDRILGDAGVDVIYGGPGNDTITTGPGADLIDAGPGNDTVDARDGDPDVINAGTGDDAALVDRGLDRVRNVDRAAFPEPDNVARGRPVRASMALPTGPAAYVTDGHRIAFWSSLYQPQWVEIDLGHQYAIKSVALVIAQTPEGLTDHVILGRATAFERWRGLADLRGTTHDRELLTATARTAWRNVRYVRIETRDSPSWVAWKEIAVFRA